MRLVSIRGILYASPSVWEIMQIFMVYIEVFCIITIIIWVNSGYSLNVMVLME